MISSPALRRPRLAADPLTFLAQARLFSGISRPETRAELARHAQRIPAARSQIVYGRARPAEGVYVVVTGNVSLGAQESRSGEKVVEICGPGESFGEECLFGEAGELTARAVNGGLLVLLPRAVLLALLERDPAVARALLASLSRKVTQATRQIGGAATRSGQQRLIGYLLQQLEPHHHGGAVVALTVPKRIVASLLGLSKETLSRQLALLAERGLIEVKGRVIGIKDVDALAALCHAGAGCAGCAGCPRGDAYTA